MTSPTAFHLVAVTVTAPSGTAWEFLALFLVVIIGPPLLERARLPGIIGLLLGGYLIGPNCLDLIGSGNTTVPELGQLGLLYLMFVAGVELDLRLVSQHLRSVVLFGAMAFAIPLVLGSSVGFSLNWSVPAAILLGSLMASHTLLTYPAVRKAGLSTHRAVATAVGATVLTDTASLIVLAFVAGSQAKGGSASAIGLQVGFGLVVLALFSLVVLPRIVTIAFRFLGTDRVVRYLLTIASFLAAATLASSVGIEGIVGAFFAGLGLNRLVPTEGPLMERIDYFGQALFVPVFLLSVGMLLQPSVMIQPETLKLAGLFVLAAVGGKTLAAVVTRRPLRLSGPETLLMLGLTIPQAAATLAATIVGFNIGLFDQSVLNAVLALILASIVAATLLVEKVKADVPLPHDKDRGVGKHVLVALEDGRQAQIGFAIAARIAAPDGGIVRGLLGCPRHSKPAAQAELNRLRNVGYLYGVDTEPSLLVHNSFEEGVVNAVIEYEPSFVLMGLAGADEIRAVLRSRCETIASSVGEPLAVIVGNVERIETIVLLDSDRSSDGEPNDGVGIASEVATRLGDKSVRVVRRGDHESCSDLVPGQLGVIALASHWDLGALDVAPGAAVLAILCAPSTQG